MLYYNQNCRQLIKINQRKSLLIALYLMISQTIRGYFKRFNQDLTESLYSNITAHDFDKNKASFQYLDFDRESVLRKNKGQLFCGIRNINNSCYLSVTLQIFYNIQYLRERIFRLSDQNISDFMRQLQKLFALMYKGSLVYVDPSSLFAVLQKNHPNLFVSGVQNDFHQVFTVMLDELQKSFLNEDDKKFVKKLFYGRMKVILSDEKDKVIKSSSKDSGNIFNLINLSIQHKSFENSLKEYKRQVIDGYVNDAGEKLKASKQINFIETPGVLSFFINRVTFLNNKIVKDNTEFDFSQKILFAKSNAFKSTKNTDAELEKMIKDLIGWVTQKKTELKNFEAVIRYFEEQQQQFPNINVPNIANPLGSQMRANTKKFILAETEEIKKEIQKSSVQIQQLQKKRIKDAQDNYSQVYNIWAVMIHCGATADYGHYKICMKLDLENDLWVEFNDRKAENISFEKVKQYKKKGQICCLFYRRANFAAQLQKGQISGALKKYVQEEQAKIIKKVDNARVLQALYQQYQSASYVWDLTNLQIRKKNEYTAYFFEPILHLIKQKSSIQTCKGLLLYQNIKQPKFKESLRNKLIDTSDFVVPQISFGIPTEYWQISEALKNFILTQLSNPVEAFSTFSFFMDITIKNNTTREIFQYIKEVCILKGIFYQYLLMDINMISLYAQLHQIINGMLNTMAQDSQFFLSIIPLRQNIYQLYNEKIKKSQQLLVKGKLKIRENVSLNMINQSLFISRFGKFIEHRKNMNQHEEKVFQDYKKMYGQYIQ